MKTKHLLSLTLIGSVLAITSVSYASYQRAGNMHQMIGSGSRAEIGSGMGRMGNMGSGMQSFGTGDCGKGPAMMNGKGQKQNGNRLQLGSGNSSLFGTGCPLIMSGEKINLTGSRIKTLQKNKLFGTGQSLTGIKATYDGLSGADAKLSFFQKLLQSFLK